MKFDQSHKIVLQGGSNRRFVLEQLKSLVSPEMKALVRDLKKNNVTIRYGCDFTGIGSPIQALKILGIPFDHVFSCDNNAHVKKSIECNYSPKYLYEDILNRDHRLLPDIDLYIAGPPCVAFSSVGLRKGLDDQRGQLFIETLEVIYTKKPKIFIIENVKGLITANGGKAIEYIESYINKNLKQYSISVIEMNTKDYGVPQSRPRIFIVGILNQLCTAEIKTPRPIPMLFELDDIKEKKLSRDEISKLTHLSTFESDNLSQALQDVPDLWKHNYVMDLCSSYRFMSIKKDIAPCFRRSHSKFFVSKWRRNISPREALSLQGFPETFEICVSDHQVYQQVGNSISVNVMLLLLQEIFLTVF